MIRLKVKEIAQKQGLSQARLSRLADVDPRTIRKIFQNPHTSLTLVVLDRIAKALEVDPSELIEGVLDEEEK